MQICFDILNSSKHPKQGVCPILTACFNSNLTAEAKCILAKHT